MRAPHFPEHTAESAPEPARRQLHATSERMGYLPAAVARLASSPQLLDGFLKLSKIFESSSLDPLARETVIMTIATHNGCHVCVAMHAAKLSALRADPDLVAALREQRPLPDTRLDAVRTFTLEALATSGAVTDQALAAFLAHGHTSANALDVVLGIGTYTLSTLANRLTDAPLDEQLEPHAWTA